MLQLAAFPPELILYILRYLPLPALNSLRQTSKPWNQLFLDNEAYIYRNAAYLHNFIMSPEESLRNAITACGRTVEGVVSWYTLCRRRYTLEANWIGRGSPWCKPLAADHDDVHRIKVDEQRGIVITTHQDGGVNVRDLDTDEVLWALPRTYVRELAHCEYGNGFLIFDRFGQGKEVWRLASEYDESPAPPDEMQQEISFIINRHIPRTKGCFRPWAVLTAPEFTRAYRFVYPNLLVAGFEKAYVWDVLTCEIVQVVSGLQDTVARSPLGHINYVELSPLHVLICGSKQLRFYDRTTGSLAFHIHTDVPGDPSHAIPFVSLPQTHDTKLRVSQLVAEQKTMTIKEIPQFVAVHVSPDGRTVAALSEDCHLVIIKDILSVIKGQQKLLDPDTSVTLIFTPNPLLTPSEAVYLAFEHGRIGVITSSGIFIVTLDAAEHNVVDRDLAVQQQNDDIHSDVATRQAIALSPFPHLRCCQVLPFQRPSLLNGATCLQMTETKMLFTWSPHAMPGMIPTADEPPPHWSWFNPPVPWNAGANGANDPPAALDEDDWPPLPGTAAAPAVMQMPGGLSVDDGELEEPGPGWHVEFPAPTEQGANQAPVLDDADDGPEGPEVGDDDSEWEDDDEDELPAVAPQGALPVPHQFLFHRTVVSSIIACVGFTESA